MEVFGLMQQIYNRAQHSLGPDVGCYAPPKLWENELNESLQVITARHHQRDSFKIFVCFKVDRAKVQTYPSLGQRASSQVGGGVLCQRQDIQSLCCTLSNLWLLPSLTSIELRVVATNEAGQICLLAGAALFTSCYCIFSSVFVCVLVCVFV